MDDDNLFDVPPSGAYIVLEDTDLRKVSMSATAMYEDWWKQIPNKSKKNRFKLAISNPNVVSTPTRRELLKLIK